MSLPPVEPLELVSLVDDPAEAATDPDQRSSTFYWATVVAADPAPVSVRLDGDSVPLTVDIDSLVDPETLTVGDRVWVQLVGAGGKRVVILGRSAGGIPAGGGGAWVGGGETALRWGPGAPQAMRGVSATTALTIPTHVAPSGGQATHPSVEYVPGGLSGYPYWMAMTPYPGGNDDHEDPNVLASYDGTVWFVPPGGTNPIDDKSGQPDHNSDPCILWDGARLHLWWRYLNQNATGAEEMLMHSSSPDGVTWATPEVAVVNDWTVARLLSPSVVRELDGTWSMWCVDMVPDPNRVVRLTATSPTGPWSAPETGTIHPVPAGQEPWHIEVRLLGGSYVALVNTSEVGASGANGDLIFATSPNGKAWDGATTGPLAKTNGSLYTFLYKASFLPVATKAGAVGFDVWYSAWRLSPSQVWNIYRTTVDGAPISDTGQVNVGVVNMNSGKSTPISFNVKFPAPPRLHIETESARLNVGYTALTRDGFTLLTDNWSNGDSPAVSNVYWTATLPTPTPGA